MKKVAGILIVVLCSLVAVGQKKIGEDDPVWRQQTVKRAFAEESQGLRTSWSEKYLARLGDSAAPEIMKCLESKALTKKDAETAMALIKMSFRDSHLIRNSSSRTPTNTVLLLDYLDKHSTDEDVKGKIRSIRERLQPGPRP